MVFDHGKGKMTGDETEKTEIKFGMRKKKINSEEFKGRKIKNCVMTMMKC